MANSFLRVRGNIPLEREYEGWIIREMEDYFALSGRKARIFGVGSAREKVWPADEELNVAGKVIGFQFKRPNLSKPPGADPTHSSKLFWKLGTPAGQLGLVMNNAEIFYALPTFTDPKYKRVSLHHCLFWRPVDAVRKTVWYNNTGGHLASSYRRVEDEMRWGYFMEKLVRCQVGRPMQANAVAAYVDGLSNLLLDARTERLVDSRRRQPIGGVYVVFISGPFGNEPGNVLPPL